jgi:hypothetical protein
MFGSFAGEGPDLTGENPAFPPAINQSTAAPGSSSPRMK